MSAEVHISPSPTDESVLLINKSPVSRRGFLYLAGGLISAAALAAGCENDRGGYIRSAEPAGAGGGADASPSPEAAVPSPYTDSTPEEASPSETYEGGPVEVAGHKLDELTGITWERVPDMQLADTIRRPQLGTLVKKDPRAVSSDVDTYNRAFVLGMPAAAAKNQIVRLALTVAETDWPFSDQVSSVVLPKGTVTVQGQRVELMPKPTTGAEVHPYRLRMGLYNMKVVFLTSPDPNRDLKAWTVVPPHTVNPGVVLANATYANAHIL